MPDWRGLSGARLAIALVLLVSLAASSCQALKKLGGGGDIDEANQFNQSASEDIREIERIVQENKGRESEVTRALNAGRVDEARKMMDDSVVAIDRGLGKGESAAGKFEKAARLDVDPTIKEYLSLRAQSVNKAIEAFKKLRQGVITFRDSTGSTDKAATEKARSEIRQLSEEFDQLISESERFERQADEIARRNPEKIKPGH
jgi:mannitol-specific phosphotransferase system IIBC component